MKEIRYYLILVLFIIDSTQSECPLGWNHYNNSCFLFLFDKYSWLNAQTNCHEHKAILAEPNDKAETDFLFSMGRLIGKDEVYWIGGRDDVIEGTWQWSSNEKVISYLPWRPGNPDNSGNEDCLEMYCNSNGHCEYNDGPCTKAFAHICERSYPGVETDIIGKRG